MIDIIIPTFNNSRFLLPCVKSILECGDFGNFVKIIIVNNGHKDSIGFQEMPGIKIIQAEKNLGWEGGLDLGLKHSTAPFVCFQNDDTQIPVANKLFYKKLLYPFEDDNVAAVGPVSTTVAGPQSIYNPMCPLTISSVGFLIYFCVVIRREYLDLVGGVDTTLPGGDDFDLSIRFNDIGKKSIINPNAFLIHHGFKTGERVFGSSDNAGGWNSPEMSEKTQNYLIKKHGFKKYMNVFRAPEANKGDPSDKEGDIVRKYVVGDKVYEFGCGGKKTVPQSIGVDIVSNGDMSIFIKTTSVADITGDVAGDLPIEEGSCDTIIARHIFEHLLDPIDVLRRWKKYLRTNGRLILAVPDERVTKGIPLNPEHCHAFVRESLKNLCEIVGFKEIDSIGCDNGISFVGVFEKGE